jgi:DNA-binding NarL/FixJ family response regulator
MESKDSTSHIVVVDDHRSIADTMAWALQSELPQFKVLGISKAAEAVTAIRNLQPAAVIVDWQLENGERAMTGCDLKQLAQAASPRSRWVLFTAHATPFVIKKAVEAGMLACVAKEKSYTELVRAVVAAMDGRRYFCETCQAALSDAVVGSDLTSSERAILREVALGREPKEIADATGLALKTVYNTLNVLRQKSGCSSMVDLAKFAVDRGAAPKIG